MARLRQRLRRLRWQLRRGQLVAPAVAAVPRVLGGSRLRQAVHVPPVVVGGDRAP